MKVKSLAPDQVFRRIDGPSGKAYKLSPNNAGSTNHSVGQVLYTDPMDKVVHASTFTEIFKNDEDVVVLSS